LADKCEKIVLNFVVTWDKMQVIYGSLDNWLLLYF